MAEQAPDQKSDYAPDLAKDAGGRQRFIGTAEQLREDCARLAEAGAQQIVLRPAMPRDPVIDLSRCLEQLELLAAELLPFCRAL